MSRKAPLIAPCAHRPAMNSLSAFRLYNVTDFCEKQQKPATGNYRPPQKRVRLFSRSMRIALWSTDMAMMGVIAWLKGNRQFRVPDLRHKVPFYIPFSDNLVPSSCNNALSPGKKKTFSTGLPTTDAAGTSTRNDVPDGRRPVRGSPLQAQAVGTGLRLTPPLGGPGATAQTKNT